MGDSAMMNTFPGSEPAPSRWMNGLSTKTKKLMAAAIAEFLGSMFLVLLAVGVQANEFQTDTLLTTDHSDLKAQSAYVLTIAIAHGMTYAVLTEVFYKMSGAHFNPAITISAIVSHRIEPLVGVLYMVVQITGAVVGSAIYNGLTDDTNYGDLGANKVNTDFNTGQIFGIEFLCSTFVVLTWFTVFVKSRDYTPPYVDFRSNNAPQTIGLAYAVGVLITSRWDSAGLNPVRAFGPSVIANNWKHQWVFWLAPIMGGLAGTLIGELFEFLTHKGKTRKISPE